MSDRKFTGQVFRVTRRLAQNPEQVLSDLSKIPLTKTERAYYHSVFHACISSADQMIDEQTLVDILKTKDLAHSRTTILRKMKKLAGIGIVELSTYEQVGKKGQNMYTLTDPTGWDKTGMTGRKAVSSRLSQKALLKALESGNHQYIEELDSSKTVTETWYTGILDRCMRYSIYEKIEDNVIKTRIPFRKAEIFVKTTTQTGGGEISILSDQRIIRAINSIAAQIIEQRLDDQRQRSIFDIIDLDTEIPTQLLIQSKNEQLPSVEVGDNPNLIKNMFTIPVSQIATLLDYKDVNSTSVRRVLNRGIKRLNETSFHTLINDPDGDLEEIFGICHKKQIFRYITGLSANYDEEMHSTLNDLDVDDFERVSVWKMSLDEQVSLKLLDPEKRQIFLAHTTIMHEGQGLAQTIYNFFSSVIGRTDQTALGEPEKKYIRKVSVLKNTLFPERRIDKFQDDLVELMKKYLSTDVKWDSSLYSNEVRMLGFIFKLYRQQDPAVEGKGKKNPLYISVSRDELDLINGNNSFHNKQISQQTLSID